MRVAEVAIVSNPILEILLHKQYLVFSMKNLKKYNEEIITEEDRNTANLQFSKRWPKCNRNTLRTKKMLPTAALLNQTKLPSMEEFESVMEFVSRNIPASRTQVDKCVYTDPV